MKYDLPVHNAMGTEDVSYAYAGRKCKQHRDPMKVFPRFQTRNERCYVKTKPRRINQIRLLFTSFETTVFWVFFYINR